MYTSTRLQLSVSASKAILDGLAPHGGLYIPTNISPHVVTKDFLHLSYNELTKTVFSYFLDDYDKTTISTIVDKAYGNNFNPSPVSIKYINNTSILELFNGETFAFKDMALQVLPLLFDEAKKIQKIDKKTIILTATSGDTGSAALSGFHKLENTHVIVLYPKHGISTFQELQMLSYKGMNTTLVGIDGNFDDCQTIVKDVFQNVHLDNAILSSANSINIGRIIPQIVYYIYSYMDAVRTKKITYGDEINITVPTGNFGNIYAAYLAKQLGLPVHRLIIASNENNVLTDLFTKHTYNINRPLLKTISPSMDILISSNFERYLYNILNDPNKVQEYMTTLKQHKEITIKEINQDSTFYALYASELNTKETIRTFYEDNQYLIDPHTAVSYYCHKEYIKRTNDNRFMIIVSTASPFKFGDAILDALQIDKPDSIEEKISTLQSLCSERYDARIDTILTTSLSGQSVPKEQAYDYVKKVLGDIHDQD